MKDVIGVAALDGVIAAIGALWRAVAEVFHQVEFLAMGAGAYPG